MNLRRKEFCILNEQYSRQEYKEKLKQYSQKSPDELARIFEEFKLTQPHVFAQNHNNDEFTGDHIFNSKNAFNCFDVNELEDCCYLSNAVRSRDCCDVDYCAWSELLYECHSGPGSYDCNFCNICLGYYR